MHCKVKELNGRRLVEGIAGKTWICNESDARLVVGICGDFSAQGVLFYPGNIAGEPVGARKAHFAAIVEPFLSNKIRMAGVFTDAEMEGQYRDLARMSGMHRGFRVFNNKSDAEAWLVE